MMPAGKVLLVFPPVMTSGDPETYRSLPMGLLLVGSALKGAGFDPKIVDCSFDGRFEKTIAREIMEDDCVFLGLSVMTSQVASALEISRLAKQARASLPVVWGGFHATLFPEQTVAHPAVDVSVIDEGVTAAVELARAYTSGLPLSDIRGIAYATSKGAVRNEPAPRLDFPDLPRPDYDLAAPERYIAQPVSRFGKGQTPRRALPLLTGLGCRFRCAFCMNSLLRRPYRTLSADGIISESRRLVETYDVDDFDFIDEHFFGDRERLDRFIELKKTAGLDYTWDTNARASDFRPDNLSPEKLAALRSSGLTRLGIGAESGSQAVLNAIRKGIKVEHVRRAARSLNEAGVAGAFSFMVGLPDETTSEYDATYRLCWEVLRLSPKSTVIGPQLFRPYPGSEIYDRAVEEYGLSEPDDLEGWSRLVSQEGGYFTAEMLPWVREPKAVRLRAFYLERRSVEDRKRARLEGLAVGIMRKVAGARLRTAFYRFPIEYHLYDVLKRRSE
ncbi:MAG: B12-binding domain-containing radical SAM protein [Candidatus Aquicultorales bacterium]